MTGLEHKDASFILLSSTRLDDMISILYAKEYHVSKDFNRLINSIVNKGI